MRVLVMNLICCMIFFFLVQLLVFIAVTAFNKRGPHGRLVFLLNVYYPLLLLLLLF